MRKKNKATYFSLYKAVMLLIFMASCDKEDRFSTANISPETFITTWKDTTTVTIPTDTTLLYNYDIDWDNDGIFDEIGITGNASHTFSTTGPHTVGIRGQFPAIQFSTVIRDGNDIMPFDLNLNKKIVAVNQWGTIAWSSMAGAFAFCDNVTFPATDVPDLSAVSNLSFMFFRTPSANPDVSQWDVSNSTNMSFMFFGVVSATPEVGQWKVSNVTDISFMFSNTESVDPDVSQWDVSNVTDMRGVFRESDANPDVSNWEVSKVTNMFEMFASASSANPDVSRWNVSNVTNMIAMFASASSANPDVSRWNVSNVTNTILMFISASSANPDVSQWKIPEIANMDNMFNNSGLSPENYAAALVNFAEQSTQQGVRLGASAINFCDDPAVQAAKETLIVARKWRITDAGSINCTTP